jgi:ankyrin repeat protein
MDMPGYDGRTPIHNSCRHPRGFPIFKFLYLNGARVDTADCKGNTGLHYLSLYGTLKHYRFLSSARLEGVDPDIANNAAETASTIFQWRVHIEEGNMAPGVRRPSLNEVMAFEDLISGTRHRNWDSGLFLHTKAQFEVESSCSSPEDRTEKYLSHIIVG